MSTSTPIPQCGQRSGTLLARPTLTQKPVLPIDFQQFGHGVSKRLQNAAARTTPTRTAKTILIARIRGAYPATTPTTRRKAKASVAYRSLRRLKYWRIVIDLKFSEIETIM